MDIGCVLMASGFGRRFGSNKLLAPAGGVPLVRRAMETVRLDTVYFLRGEEAQ